MAHECLIPVRVKSPEGATRLQTGVTTPGQGASLAPFRAILTYSGNGNLPEEILVRFGNSHGDFTAIEGVLAE